MKRLLQAIIFVFLFIAFINNPLWSETYPEYTGNYIDCGGKWCELEAYQLDVMMLWEVLSRDKYGHKGENAVSYAGFFSVPEAIVIKNKKPRILTYTGRSNADPMTIALVELAKLPYNNAPVYEINGTEYKQKIRYSNKYVKNELWTFKREILLRFKPVEGKTGMFIFEPAEPLTDGLYVIDSGLPTETGHKSLSTAPGIMDFYKVGHVQIAIPFIMGNVNKDKPSSLKSPSEKVDDGKKVDTPSSDTSGDTSEKSIDSLLKSIFGK